MKAQQYFVSLSCVFLDKKTLIKIFLNPGLNLTIFQGTRCRSIIFLRILQITRKRFHWRILSQSPDALNRKTKTKTTKTLREMLVKVVHPLDLIVAFFRADSLLRLKLEYNGVA